MEPGMNDDEPADPDLLESVFGSELPDEAWSEPSLAELDAVASGRRSL